MIYQLDRIDLLINRKIVNTILLYLTRTRNRIIWALVARIDDLQNSVNIYNQQLSPIMYMYIIYTQQLVQAQQSLLPYSEL